MSTSHFTTGSSHFTSGFDRWLALQEISDKMSRRAGTLNSMEKLRLDRATKQIDYKLQISESHYTKVCERLRDTLKDHDLYKKALNRNRCFHGEGSNPTSADMNVLGRYQGKTYRTLAEDMKLEEKERRNRRKLRNAKLLEECRKQSDVLIDPRVPTHYLLTNKGVPLSERLRSTKRIKLKGTKPKIQAVAAFTKVRETIAKRKEECKKERVYAQSKGVFHTEVPDF